MWTLQEAWSCDSPQTDQSQLRLKKKNKKNWGGHLSLSTIVFFFVLQSRLFPDEFLFFIQCARHLKSFHSVAFSTPSDVAADGPSTFPDLWRPCRRTSSETSARHPCWERLLPRLRTFSCSTFVVSISTWTSPVQSFYHAPMDQVERLLRHPSSGPHRS